MQSQKASLKLWLSMQCQMLGNVSAAILAQTSSTAPIILAKWPNADANNANLRDALKHAVDIQRLYLTPEGDDFIIGQPLVIDGEFWGVLVLQLQLADKKELPAILKHLKLGQYWLQFLLHQQAEVHAEPPMPVLGRSTSSALLQLGAGLLTENSVQETAISLVNQVAGFLQATRVSLGLHTTTGIELEAVSFSASFGKRTQVMQAVKEAMLEAMEQGCALDYVSVLHQAPERVADAPSGAELLSESESPALITRAHQQLQQLQQLQSVHSLPVRNREAIVGVLTVELDKQSDLSAEQRHFLQQALNIAGAILALRLQVSASIWQGLRRRTAQRVERWVGKESWRGKVIGALLLFFVVALFVPLEYRISGDATLQTTEKYLVVSPQDGYLGKVLVRPGAAVKKGEALAQLKDEELRLERLKLASQVQQYRQAYDAALANSSRVEAAIANAQMEQASIQLRLIDQQLGRTQLLAPMDGIVVSDDISQTQGAPLKQGDVLFEIAAAQGFLVQLYVDERDVAAVQSGQQGQVKFSSLPGDTFAVRVKNITPISEVREGRNYFRVDLELIEERDVLRPGMTGTGKLVAGRRALGWIWFHDLWHWLRLKLW
ncbi:MAG TPA: efflux RND transporter periplasmic adaptor subunit [Cellvibrio sp.]|nr:efflux RND transporter periplasmic adaptor subunit [Cellvibrio sp.]